MRSRSGFTLVEAMVAVAILAIGFVGGMGALTRLGENEVKVRSSERVWHLAQQKLDEVIATGEVSQAPLDGTFEGANAKYSWALESEPTTSESIFSVRMTVWPTSASRESGSVTLIRLLYVPPTGGTTQ